MLPRGLRNNNPGNIEDSPFTRSQPGYVGSDGRFAQFDTIDNGYGAMASLYNSGGYRGLNTVNQIIGRWAPTSDGNNVPAYAGYVANRLGITPDTPLNKSDSAQMRALAQAQAEYENGPGVLAGHMPATNQQTQAPQMADQGTLYPQQQAGPDWGAALSGLGAGLVTAVNPGAGAQLQQNFNQMMLARQPKLITTTDAFGQQHVGAYDPRTGVQLLTAAQRGTAGTGNADLGAAIERFQQTGDKEELSRNLPPGVMNYVDDLLAGKADPRLLAARGSGFKNGVYTIAHLFGADDNTLAARAKMYKDMVNAETPATFGGQLKSAGTLAQHYDRWLQNSEKLASSMWFDSSRDVNTVQQWWAKHSTSPEVKTMLSELEEDRDFIAHEQPRLLKGSGQTNVTEQNEMRAILDPRKSIEEKRGIARQGIGGALDRLNESAAGYNTVFNTNKQTRDFLSPGAQVLFDRILGPQQQQAPQAAPANRPPLSSFFK